ncbi:class I SAM-dependent methyltransferase [Methanoculleus sp. Wushi-C6]|uniref:Class I SAM-dependent methyltransferase n=1 Tax=Methanoculleus caldifontis TaxID=2651577 RepID=A0ABU3X3G4_9EURY|nr:class I SAM-dependent methyltransferase [Methanoculleus sp. Wushi-C6]MDV2482610.1 class I SAM-dependent methyltransferase [Methanoculleus sp. Wushi-C6]
MNAEDIKITRQRYSERHRTFGYSPQTLGWGKHGRQALRFSVLTAVGNLQGKSILDVGCGFGDLYDYLTAQGWTGHYVGIDLVPDLVEEGRKRFPDAELLVGDFEEQTFTGRFDYVVASGIFNFLLTQEDNWAYIMRTLEKMLALAQSAVAVDFMTTWVDFQNPIAFHTDPCVLIQNIRSLTRRFTLRQDYMPYEYALYLYHDTPINHDNTFPPI